MEITIPAWATYLIGTFGGGFMVWLVFLTKMNYQNKEDIKIASQNDAHILGEISKLENSLSETRSDFSGSLSRLSDKIDNLLGDVQFMKGSLAAQPKSKSV